MLVVGCWDSVVVSSVSLSAMISETENNSISRMRNAPSFFMCEYC